MFFMHLTGVRREMCPGLFLKIIPETLVYVMIIP